MNKKFGQVGYGVILLIWAFLLLVIRNQQKKLNFVYDRLQKYAPIETVDAFLQAEYYDQESLVSGQQQMVREAMKAYINGLGDPYTVYMDADTTSDLQQELEWEWKIEGIGAVVSKKDYYVQIEEVIKGSPAFQAWLLPLDRIVMIGTGETKELTTSEAVGKIRWEKGTTVKLFIERLIPEGKNEYFEKEVVRDEILVPSVKGKVLTMSGYKLGYLEVSVFWDQTNKLMNQAISEFIEQKIDGVILDLRGNGWGLLETAVDLAGHFLSKDTLVVTTKYRNYQDINYKTKWFAELSQYPTVILLDGLSASASEILALALKENRNLKVVWEKSFWKGSIQTLQELKNADAIKYTVWKWYGPRGTSIDQVGIIPDMEVEFDLTGYVKNSMDSQLIAAQKVLIQEISDK